MPPHMVVKMDKLAFIRRYASDRLDLKGSLHFSLEELESAILKAGGAANKGADKKLLSKAFLEISENELESDDRRRGALIMLVHIKDDTNQRLGVSANCSRSLI